MTGIELPLVIIFWSVLGGGLAVSSAWSVEKLAALVLQGKPFHIYRPALYCAGGLVLIQLGWVATWALWARTVMGMNT